MKKYIIWAPKYYKSNGIKVLYKLHDLLLEKGYDVYMYAQPTEYKCKYISPHRVWLGMRAEKSLKEIVICAER